MSNGEMQVAIVIFASTESHEGLARAVNALQIAKEITEAGGKVEVIFDGAGVVAAAELSAPEHSSHRSFTAVEDHIAGVCEFCSNAFGVKERLQESGTPLLSEYQGHPSVHTRLANGYHVLTF